MLANVRRTSLVLCAIILTACASQSASTTPPAPPAKPAAAAPAADKVAQAVDAPESAAEPPSALGSDAELAATLELDDSSPSHVN